MIDTRPAADRDPDLDDQKLPRVPASRRWRRVFFLALGLSISAFFLYRVFRNLPISEVLAALRTADILWITVAGLATVLSILLRGVRWKVLLHKNNVRLMASTELVAIGLAANGIMAGRIGDLIRIGLSIRRLSVRPMVVIGSVVAERLLDGITLLITFAAVMLVLPSLSDSQVTMSSKSIDGHAIVIGMQALAGVVVLLTVAVLSLLSTTVRGFVTATVTGIGLIPKALAVRIASAIDGLADGLLVLRSRRLAIPLVSLSFAVWAAIGLCNWLVQRSMPDLDLTVVDIIAMTAVSIAASSIPSAPGAWGVFEAGALLSLMLTGQDPSDPRIVAFVFLAHACQYFPVLAMGLMSVLRTGASETISAASRS